MKPFPKQAKLAGEPITLLGPYIRFEGGAWHHSHTDVVADFRGAKVLVPIVDLEEVQITEEEMEEIETEVAAIFPDVVRMARAITGQRE